MQKKISFIELCHSKIIKEIEDFILNQFDLIEMIRKVPELQEIDLENNKNLAHRLLSYNTQSFDRLKIVKLMNMYIHIE